MNDRDPADPAPAPILRAEGLVKHYPDGDVQALRGVSLEVAAGRVRGDHRAQRLRQEHAAAPARRPRSADRGRGLLPGQPLVPARPRRVPRPRDRLRLPVVPPVPTLTALENVQIPMFEGPWPRRERAQTRRRPPRRGRACRIGGGHRPGQLSVGERQRVAIARALANEPSPAPGRRADRQPRQQEPGRDPPAARPAPRAGAGSPW